MSIKISSCLCDYGWTSISITLGDGDGLGVGFGLEAACMRTTPTSASNIAATLNTMALTGMVAPGGKRPGMGSGGGQAPFDFSSSLMVRNRYRSFFCWGCCTFPGQCAAASEGTRACHQPLLAAPVPWQ